MAVNAGLRVALLRAFDDLHRQLDRPALYAVPWQTPAGATYDADVDAWLDGTGAVVTKTPAELTYYAIPALWGANAESLALTLGGVSAGGEMAAVARAQYQPQLAGAMLVVLGSLTGDKYTLANLESAPDGGAAIFAVAGLKRKEQ